MASEEFKFEIKGFELPQKVEVSREELYDVVIVGAGAAGLSAGIYAARYALKTMIVSKDIGGLTAVAGLIENYPGFTSIDGAELMNRFVEHAKSYNIKIQLDTIIDIRKTKDGIFEVISESGNIYRGRTVILCLGAERRKLGVQGEEELLGKGVSYCATCDAPIFKDKIVAVVGGGDTAVKEAIHLTDYAKKVYIIHRRDKFRAEQILLNRLYSKKNIEFILNKTVQKILGKEKVEGVLLNDGTKLKIDGIFVAIGIEPPRRFFEKLGLKVDNEGYVIVNNDQSTSISGLYAAGDCTTGSNKFRQTLTAAAEGAIAADSAYKYIIKNYGEPLGTEIKPITTKNL